MVPNEVLLSFDTEMHVGDEEAVVEILDVLYEYDASSTFFIMGSFADNNPEIIRRMVDEGHEVACHTQNHKNLMKLDKEEISKEISECKNSIEKITDKKAIGFRAPWRIITPKTFEVLNEEDFIYDASLFEIIPYFSSNIKEVKTSAAGMFPLDDYILTRSLHLPKSLYFFIMKNSFDRRISISFHPHIIIGYKQEFKELIEYYYQKNTTFLTHEESLQD